MAIRFKTAPALAVVAGALLAAAGLPASVFAAPAQVIIIRHGEKPPTGNDLDAQGYQRAQALVGFFETNPAVTQYGTPAAIYAMAPGSEDGSMRPIETVTPLAQSLGLSINEQYTKDQIQQAVSAIMGDPQYDGKMVLVCWEHTMIPQMAQDFGATQAPAQWPGDVFDRAWILTFSGDQVVSFQNIPQHLLPGDSSN